MEKIKLLVRELDGVTLIEQTPTFQLVDGWSQASIAHPAGIFPAGLWRKVPGGDPYLLHVNVLRTGGLAETDFFELQSGSPVQTRVQYRPTPDNTRIILVRPSDRLRFFVAPEQEVKVELLVESIGGVNELGSRLFGWAQATQASNAGGAGTAQLGGPAALPAWTGTLHVIHSSAAADVITLPPRALVPLDAMMTFTKRGIGTPVLTAGVGDSLSGGLPNFAVTRSVFVLNNGHEWAFVGA